MKVSNIFKQFILEEINRLTQNKSKGRPLTLKHEEAIDCVFKVLRTGMQWREIQSSVSYATVFRRFQAWSAMDIFKSAYRRALSVYQKLVSGKYYCIDSSYVKNRFGQSCVGKNHTDRGRKAAKVSIITDQNGVSHSISMYPGNKPDVILLTSSLQQMLVSLESLPLYADRGYDSKHNRAVCNSFGLKDRIFRRRTKTCRRSNAKRIVVEHSFSWMDKFRRLLMLYEQTSAPFLSFTFLGLGHHLCQRFFLTRNQFL